MNLNQEQKELIIRMIKENRRLPDNMKEILFGKEISEYELRYAGKWERGSLANLDGTFPLPLQVDKF